MAKKRNIHENDNRRNRLLKKAIMLFAQKGYAATSVREIVKASDTTAPSLYYYFGSKEGLFLELVETNLDEINNIIDRYANTSFESTREKIKKVIDSTFVKILANRELFLILSSVYHGPPTGTPFIEFNKYKTRFSNLLSQIISDGIKSGEFRQGNASDMALVVQGVLKIGIDDQLLDETKRVDRKMLRRLLDLIIDGFENPKGNRNISKSLKKN